MKRFFLLTLLIVVLALALPVLGYCETSVRVTLTSNDVWVGNGEQANLKIDVLNTGTESITITGYTINGQTETTSTVVEAGAVYRFYVKATIDFGTTTQKSIISSVNIDSIGTVSSNAAVLYRATSVPAVLTIDPLSTVVKSGDKVEYTITFKNTSAYDYSNVSIDLDGAEIVTAFACAADEEKTFSYSKTYTQASEHVFSYAFDYLESDGSTQTSGGSERATVSIYLKQPSGTLLAGAELVPGVLTAMVEEGGAYSLKLFLKNKSDTALSTVHVYDQNGTDYGGWSKIGVGQTAGMTVSLSPVEETTYIFTAYGEDASGEMRMIKADAVLLAVGHLPGGFGQAGSGNTAVATPKASEPISIAKASTSKKIYVTLGIVIGAIVLVLLLIVAAANGRKTIVRKGTRKKSSGRTGRNFF